MIFTWLQNVTLFSEAKRVTIPIHHSRKYWSEFDDFESEWHDQHMIR